MTPIIGAPRRVRRCPSNGLTSLPDATPAAAGRSGPRCFAGQSGLDGVRFDILPRRAELRRPESRTMTGCVSHCVARLDAASCVSIGAPSRINRTSATPSPQDMLAPLTAAGPRRLRNFRGCQAATHRIPSASATASPSHRQVLSVTTLAAVLPTIATRHQCHQPAAGEPTPYRALHAYCQRRWNGTRADRRKFREILPSLLECRRWSMRAPMRTSAGRRRQRLCAVRLVSQVGRRQRASGPFRPPARAIEEPPPDHDQMRRDAFEGPELPIRSCSGAVAALLGVFIPGCTSYCSIPAVRSAVFIHRSIVFH